MVFSHAFAVQANMIQGDTRYEESEDAGWCFLIMVCTDLIGEFWSWNKMMKNRVKSVGSEQLKTNIWK